MIEIKEVKESLLTPKTYFKTYFSYFAKTLIPAFISVISSFVIIKSIKQESEIRISNQPNAWSSVFYALVTNYYPISVKFPLFVLSVASFSLWSHSNEIINVVDVTSIYWVIIAVSVYLLPTARHKTKILFFINVGISSLLIVVTSTDNSTFVLEWYKSNIVSSTAIVYSICGCFLSSFYLTDKTFLIGVGVTSFGFCCKLLTIYAKQVWGTCIFHICTAVGIGILSQIKNSI